MVIRYAERTAEDLQADFLNGSRSDQKSYTIFKIKGYSNDASNFKGISKATRRWYWEMLSLAKRRSDMIVALWRLNSSSPLHTERTVLAGRTTNSHLIYFAG